MNRMIPHSRAWLIKSDMDSLLKAMEEGSVSHGRHSDMLSEAMRTYSGMGQCHLYASGALALRAALEAIGAPKGSGVAIPSFTCGAVMTAVINAGLEPVAVDCDERGLLLSEDVYRLAGRNRIAGAVAVHQFGLVNKAMEGAASIIPVIEDCSHVPPRRYLKGSSAVIGSFEASKLLGAGEGGYLLLDDAGESLEFDALSRASLGGKLSDLMGLLALKQLERVDLNLSRREEIAKKYIQALGGDGGVVNGDRAGWYGFLVRMDSMESALELIEKAESELVGAARPIMPHPLHRYLNIPPAERPISERLWETLVSIPIYPCLESAEVDRIRRLLSRMQEKQ